MRRFYLLMCAILACSTLPARDIEQVSITYEYYSNDPNESPEQAEQTAIEKAKQKALEEKFGMDRYQLFNLLAKNGIGTRKYFYPLVTYLL